MSTLRTVRVVPYDPAWQALYEAEAELLRSIFGALLLEIHHVGSTSVPGLEAKPIIDIMPVVADIAQVETLNGAMEQAGYEPKGEFGIAERRYFQKGGALHRSHQVHVYAPGNSEIERHLQFRDYLRAHPDEAARYGALKRALAQQFPQDIHGYMAGKDGLVKELIAKANDWHHNRAGLAGGGDHDAE